jgi:hypothetical protein
MEEKRRIRNTVGKDCWEGEREQGKKEKLLERKEGKIIKGIEKNKSRRK